MTIARRFRKSSQGQALVEFALVMPLLLILVISVFEFGRAWNLHQTITDAAREGARKAVIFDNTITLDSVQVAISNRIAASGFDPANAAVSFPDGFHTGTNNITSVRIEYPFRFTFLRVLIGLLAGNDGVITMATVARMRNE
jgi:Flp pilus assembly protein TadG